MKVIDHLRNNHGPCISFEIIPPLKGQMIRHVYEDIEPLLEFKPRFINVTYHREEYVFKEREGGLLEKFSIRKRPGTVGICAALMYKYDIDTVPHIICGGFSREETENALIDLHYLGVHNALVVRGDPIKTETYFKPHPRGHSHASELLQQIKAMNKGVYLDQDIEDPWATDFCVGVAGYPEKHFEAPNQAADLRNLARKVELGAEYVITQMCFDADRFLAFVEQCRGLGIEVPILPGIKPLSSFNQVRSFPTLFHIEIPEALLAELDHCKSNHDVELVGREWAVTQCRKLLAGGVPGLHFYTMSRSGPTREVLKAIL
ncbi:MAG: methylenetetrahydrofolate reductase [NAD(P)H] [Deltaproteobacteria bacterium RIFOXYA12_FULL_61_11]|nr:MAG: methylenetetrahydrofolate reductase [NAD(P)H] [Deltaproteobacteria bacterium RIFOXYA12_FULL_61_11]